MQIERLGPRSTRKNASRSTKRGRPALAQGTRENAVRRCACPPSKKLLEMALQRKASLQLGDRKDIAMKSIQMILVPLLRQ